jgi:hypothetical protein
MTRFTRARPPRKPSTEPPAPDGWLRALVEEAEDLYAAAEDATRPLGQRDLGRRLARKHIKEAGRNLRGLLASPPAQIAPPGSSES